MFNNVFETEEDINNIFGQINFFFRLEFMNEPCLFGLPMASIVMRKTTKINTLINVQMTGTIIKYLICIYIYIY